jgi:hypothetical protein
MDGVIIISDHVEITATPRADGYRGHLVRLALRK